MSYDKQHKSTCSPESLGGPSPCDSQDGPTTDLFGQAVAHASRSARQANAKAPPTSGTSGPTCSGSSQSAGLSALLVSKLRARLDTAGSMEYSQTWKQKATPAGRLYWAHTASARRTSGSDCSGWPTPKVQNCQGSGPSRVGNKADLQTVAGWATPATRDHKDTGDLSKSDVRKNGKVRNDTLPRQAYAIGQEASSSPAATEKRGVLNPALPRWLMGFPPAWCDCAVTATPSSRKSPPRS